MFTRRRLLSLAPFAFAAACAPRIPAEANAFQGALLDWAQEILRDSPELATHAGLGADVAGEGFARRLDDRSTEAAERRRGAALRRHIQLRAIPAAALREDERITFAILSEQFAASADAAAFSFGRFSPLGGAAPYVLNQMDAAFLNLPDFFDTRMRARTLGDAEDYVARLRGVADALDAETERARADHAAGVTPPAFIIDATLSSLQALIDTPAGMQSYVTRLRSELEQGVPAAAPGSALNADQRRAAALIAEAEALTRDAVTPALIRAGGHLRAMRAQAGDGAGVWRLRDGEAYYRALLRLETTAGLSPADIHQIGIERVGALSAQADIALRRRGLVQGGVGERLAALSADPAVRYPDSDAGRAQLLADVRARIDRVMALAPRWFGRLPRAALQIRRVPAYAEGAAPGAYYDGPSLDGASPGAYYINLRNLSELTRVDLPTQDFHEAVPGHHFQIALAREQTNLPLLRRLMGFNAYSEGWALYAEQLADEQGLHDGDPLGRIGYLRWQLWRAARLVVDTGLHALRWSREQAIAYLTQVTGDAPGVIASEVARYAALPGQACSYELGRRAIAEARELARNRQGPQFDLRAFHDMVLAEGETPLTVLGERARAFAQRG